MTSALNIIAVKYMNWVSGRILRTLMVSSIYIQLNKHHLSKYFLLWDSKGTVNCHFRTTFALQSWISETLSELMSIPMLCCYALRNLKHIVPQSTLRTIYYAYIQSILSYVSCLFYKRKLLESLLTLGLKNPAGKLLKI
jgi:hypothetical protein